MSKEESIYIGERMSDEEFEAYFKRVEDPNNYSLERWEHLINCWMSEVMRIADETEGFTDNGTPYYKILLQKLKQLYETPVLDFTSHYLGEHEGNVPIDMQLWKPINTNEDWKLIFPQEPVSLIVDIEHPNNWNKLFVKINRDDLFKIQVKYEGFKSDWIDISHNAMNQSETQGKLSTEWYNIILHFCNNNEFRFKEEKMYYRVNKANEYLKKWFLPKGKGKASNPLKAKDRIYTSLINFLYSD